MEKLRKLKLNQISKNSLCSEELVSLKGGYEGYECCACGCNGPSGNYENRDANSAAGYSTTQGDPWVCIDWYSLTQWYEVEHCYL